MKVSRVDSMNEREIKLKREIDRLRERERERERETEDVKDGERGKKDK